MSPRLALALRPWQRRDDLAWDPVPLLEQAPESRKDLDTSLGRKPREPRRLPPKYVAMILVECDELLCRESVRLASQVDRVRARGLGYDKIGHLGGEPLHQW